MKRTVLLYGALSAALITALQLAEYRFLVLEHSLEIYGGIVALLFSALGIWLGLRLTRPVERIVVREVPVEVPVELPVPAPPAEPFVADEARLERLGVTPREHEILQLIAAGLSTREIAERLGVSENTVKTHSGRIFAKLGARRRTEAVRRGKEERILP
jgi:two-component system, NarL family, response regulator LiaR